MRKLLFILFLFLSVNAFAQVQKQKAFEKHSSTITLGYGIKNLWTIFQDKVVDISDYKVRSSGPYTLSYEYGILKRFSIGLSAGYSRVTGQYERFQIHDQITFLSLLARANYHLWTTYKLDPYFGAGIGINNSKYKNLEPQTVLPPNSNVPSTIDFSGQLGIKYFPTKHFGICAEVGYITGAIALIGITGRF